MADSIDLASTYDIYTDYSPKTISTRDMYESMIIILAILIVLVVLMHCFQRKWAKRQNEHDQEAGHRMKAEAVIGKIVRYFTPSVQTRKRRFKSLSNKGEHAVDIRFENLGLEIEGVGPVLAGVSGEFKAGRMCAIMGPSGAGKTTFMNCLCGKAYYGKMTGQVFINGKEGKVSDFKPCVGFVPQDDVVHENLTVAEQVEFSAALRLPPGSNSKAAGAITEDVLQLLQIHHIRNSIVGSVENRGISGGQRKRVNIALELAADPTVLFLDEPTSGLDATSAQSIVQSLKNIGDLGMTSIMIIHQPRYSLFTMFDEVLLLGKGGRTVYIGPSVGAVPYFESLGFRMPKSENPADWLMDLISGEVPNEKIANFEPSMLFTIWEENKDKLPKVRVDKRQPFNPEEDQAALVKSLQSEFRKYDADNKGYITMEELSAMLFEITGRYPEDDVVEDLFERMGTTGEPESVTMEAFVNYITGSRQEAINAESDLSSESNSEDDEDGFCGTQSESRRRLTATGSTGLDRKMKSPFAQFPILVKRQLAEWGRKNLQRLVFLGTCVYAAVNLGILDRFICPTMPCLPEPLLNLHSALAFMIAVICCGHFGADRLVFWRESASGISVVSFYFARVCVNAIDIFLHSAIYTAAYFLIMQPNMPFWTFYLPLAILSLGSAGLGYFIATFMPPSQGPFMVTIVIFLSCGMVGGPLRVQSMLKTPLLELFVDCAAMTRWSVGMGFIAALDNGAISPPDAVSPINHVILNTMTPIYRDAHWMPFGYYWSGFMWLAGHALIFHIAAFLGLKYLNRAKQV